jgi:hypothetical protein
MMKFLLAAVNAKYIHSNPGIYSLKAYAERTRGDLFPEGAGLPSVHVEIGEYTINNQMEQILEDIYRRKPDMVGFFLLYLEYCALSGAGAGSS